MAAPVTAAPAAPTATAPVTAPGAPATKTVTAPAAAEIRKLKLKIDGGEVEMPEGEVIALAQQGKSAGKRYQEAADLRRQAEEILKAADDPTAFLTKKGKDVRKWAEEFLMGELKREAMSPEQRKALENEGKLKQFEDEKKTATKKAHDDQVAA